MGRRVGSARWARGVHGEANGRFGDGITGYYTSLLRNTRLNNFQKFPGSACFYFYFLKIFSKNEKIS